MKRDENDWRMRPDRRTVSLSGLALRNDGTSSRVAVTNLSYDGCHLYSQDTFELGEPLRLSVQGMGTIRAQVRWVKEQSAGVRFLHDGSAVNERRARLGV